MDYQDQLAVGNVFNQAIERVLVEYGIPDLYGPTWTHLISAIAQSVLVKLDQADYQIVGK